MSDDDPLKEKPAVEQQPVEPTREQPVFEEDSRTSDASIWSISSSVCRLPRG
jgi:hypothetical protein